MGRITYVFEIVQHIAAIHTRMSRNLKQFCLFFKIHLDFLSVANSTLDDVEIKIHDLVGSKLHFSLW